MRRFTARGLDAAILLWSCIALFAARVIGQLEVLLLAPEWLPEMDAWYSGLLPYPVLLPAQILILMIMSVVAWNRRIRTGRFARAKPRVAAGLRGFALLYFAAMAARLALQGMEHAIPIAFHWVLALFVLVSARAAPAARDELEESDDVPYGDVPPLPQRMGYRYSN
jgi:hypothetical protein